MTIGSQQWLSQKFYSGGQPLKKILSEAFIIFKRGKLKIIFRIIGKKNFSQLEGGSGPKMNPPLAAMDGDGGSTG